MFDFLISVTDRNCINPFEKTDTGEFNASTFKYNHKRVSVFGLCRNGGQKPLINENYLFFVYGNIFRRNYLKDSKGEIKYTDLMPEIIADRNNINNYKGNFVLFLIDLNKESLTILNSQLGIKHAYYFISGKDFYVSSNLSFLRTVNDKINITGLLQYMMFTYTIDGSTLLENVKYVKPGEILEFDGSLTVTEYYNISQMFEKVTGKFDLNLYNNIFSDSIEKKYSYGENPFVSFTGGFDGRTIISYLLKAGKDINAYSFGKKNGENTIVPEFISTKLNIKYSPIYLENDYEESYISNAKKVIYYSDGISFNERANYIYAFSQLAKSTGFVISGLIGGETLRPVHLKTDYLNQNYFDMFYSGNDCDYESVFNGKLSGELFEFDINDYRQELISQLNRKKQEIDELKKDYGYLYYLIDLMQLGFRMYYGTEIHFERYFCENLPPYYDIDLLEYLYSTDYVSIFKNAFRDNKMFRWKGQKIYANIIASNFPTIGDFPVDRGYPPSYLLNPFKLLSVPFLYSRRKRTRGNNPDFNEPLWSKLFLKDYMSQDYNSGILNDSKLKSKVNAFIKNNSPHDSTLTRLVSLQTWLTNK